MKTNILPRALFAIALFALTGAAQAQTTLDFEALPNPNNGITNSQGSFVSENGFTVADMPTGNGLRSVAPDGGFGLNYTGSVALFNFAEGGITTLTQNSGGPFNLNRIDLANYLVQALIAGGDTVNFTGHVRGGGTVTQSFTLAASDALQTFAFNASFTNLTSVTFVQDDIGNQFDNIVVTPVPAPSSLAVFTGLAGIGGLALRRRRN